MSSGSMCSFSFLYTDFLVQYLLTWWLQLQHLMIIELGLWKNKMRNYLREYVCIRGLEMLVFLEIFAYVLNGWSLFWISSSEFCYRMKGIEFIYQSIQRFFFMLSMILFHAPESFVYVLNGWSLTGCKDLPQLWCYG